MAPSNSATALLERPTDGQESRAVEMLASPRDRRAYQRLRDSELEWVRTVRLAGGKGVALVDLSAGGALLDSPQALRPASLLTLQIAGRGVDTAVEFRVLRCQVGAIGPHGPTYRAACEFTRLIELPRGLSLSAPAHSSGSFVGLDLALKQLVDHAGPSGIHPLDPECVTEALRALQARALKYPQDPIGLPLAELLGQIVPALEHDGQLSAILIRVEQQLRQTIPQASLRLVSPGDSDIAGMRSTLIKLPGVSESPALVSIDIPRGVVLNDWQTRVLRITSRVVALLQCVESQVPLRVEKSTVPPPSERAERAMSEAESSPVPSAWQKIVVRYVEGQILKGYTHDFGATRQQFSLWPSPVAAAHERVIVPLARLKAVFFVRDFAGNPDYVERTDTGEAQHGRRIEVTLVDDEVIVGRTLSYRADGSGFFVVPADPRANNIRVFVVASSVRQVRFP
jgi:hypothetical protein